MAINPTKGTGAVSKIISSSNTKKHFKRSIIAGTPIYLSIIEYISADERLGLKGTAKGEQLNLRPFV